MPTNYPVPTHDALRETIAGVIGKGRSVTVAATDADAPDKGVLADYGIDDGPVGVCCVADLRLTNAVGAALASETAEQVEAAVTEGVIADATFENWNDVVQQIGRLFNSPDTPPLRARAVHRLPAELPDETSTLLAQPLARRSYEVTIDDFGSGTLLVAFG